VGGGGWENSRKQWPAEEEEQPQLVGRGVLAQGKPEPQVLALHRNLGCPWRNTLDGFSMLTGQVRVFGVYLVNICVSSE